MVRVGCAAAFALIVGWAGLVAADAPAAASGGVITTGGGFWTVSEAERQRSQRLRLDLVVHYYDAEWRLLWGRSTNGPVYLPVSGQPLPLKTGQLVRIEGTVVPARGIRGEEVTVRVLAEQTGLVASETAGKISDVSRFDADWVSVAGYVCQQQEVDASHVQFTLLVEGRLVTARLHVGNAEPIPQLVNARVTVNAVYVGVRDPAGQAESINLWVPRRSDITLDGWLNSDPRFELPRTPINQVPGLPEREWVRIVGEVRARYPGQLVTVRDEAGQITVRTEQPLALEPGDEIEIVGRPRGREVAPTLLEPVIRPKPRGVARPAPADSAVAPLKLRLAEQVMELRPEEAAQRYPVALKGVVTWSDPTARFFFLQDSSAGVRVQLGVTAEVPASEALVTVDGVSDNGQFAPQVTARTATLVGTAMLPVPRSITLEQALTGAEEGRWVELRGFVRAVTREGQGLRLNLTTVFGEFSALAPPDPALESLVGAVVRITGVCSAVANPQRQLTGIQLLVGGRQHVHIEEPPPADPFAAPARTIASLQQFAALAPIDRRTRLSGQVLVHMPGRYLYLQDGTGGVLVLSRETTPLAPGAEIEVVGFPGRQGRRLVLREAIWRSAPSGPPIAAFEVAHPAQLAPDADARLVRVRARLHESIDQDGGRRLVLNADDRLFEATLAGPGRRPDWAPGSLLEVRGVYVLEYDEYRRPRTFRMELRSFDDVAVLQVPSWWTTRRAVTLAAVLALCSAGGTLWVAALRRRVRQQTEQIRTQMEQEARLREELERSSRLESLGVLAGGIAHDFNNLLTVVTANVGLAKLDHRVRAHAGSLLDDAERGARRAAELTQQLLTFAKGGSPVRAAVALPDVVREAAAFARHGSQVRCEFDFAPNLPPANADRAQFSRLVHNLIINAVQAMPQGGVVKISLRHVQLAAGEVARLEPGSYSLMEVADQGGGIAPEHLPRIFEPYFSTKSNNSGLGLATVHSIVKKHQGHITVESEPGRSTTFRVWLPVATTPIAAPPPVPTAPPGRIAARVLFMDDEDFIRQAAGAILRHLGHEVTMARDGAEAVRKYEESRAAGCPFDVVVLDLTVPGGMGGRAAMEALRDIDPQVRAIVSSGYSSDPVLANHREFGFRAVVRKPYTIEEMAQAICEIMALPARADTAAAHSGNPLQ